MNHYKSMGIFPEAQWHLTPQSDVLILLDSKPIRDFMVVLVTGFVTCKNKEEPIKNEGARVITRVSPL